MKACASCGEENPDRARFCIACGTELEAEQAGRFRKVITLLFCDVIEAPALADRLPPDELAELLRTYYDAMRPIIESHGGTVAKFIGDAIMAVFGVPVLHEDDALRACRAALELRARLAELNEELEARWRVTLHTRTGLNTGEVSGVGVARAQNFVAGDAANTAARFQQNARPGQILMGDDTYRLVRDAVGVEHVGPLEMKGKSAPVRAYHLVEVRADAEALRRRHDAPLVGRERELELLEQEFRSVVEERRCGIVALLADAGTGKSRLVEELARRLRGTALVLRGRCLSYGEGITFWPLLEIVRRLADVEEDDLPETAVRKLAAVAGHEAEDAALRVASAVGLTDDQFPLTEIFWGVRRLLEAVALREPLVVVVDDVHWAEPALLDLVEHLLEHVSGASLLVICPARPEFFEQRPAWRDRQGVTELRLGPLSEDEVERVIANMLGNAGLAEEARNRIVAAAEGNPLFVEQMVSMLLDEGLLRQVDGRYEASSELAAGSVPPSLTALLAARIDHLAPGERGVIEPAAVVGLVFPETAIADLADGDVRPQVPTHLDRLSDKQLIREGTAEHDGGREYRFGHLLIRDAAYAGLLKAARADLHERVGEWSERTYTKLGREAEFEEIFGYHFEQAYRLRAELGPLDERGRGLGERGARWLALAGRRAVQRADMQAAANLLGRAEALLPARDARRLELLPDLGEALAATGDFARALEVLDDAVSGAEAGGAEALAAESTLVRLYVQGFATEAGWGSRILPDVDRAMTILERQEEHAALAKGWRLRGAIHGTACRYGQASDAVQQALVHARLAGDRRQELRNASAYALALLSGPAPVPEAIAECERILELAGADRGTRAYVLAVLARLHAMEEAPDEARTCYVAARALFEDLGLTVHAAWVSLQSGPAELLAGDLAAAERELTRAYDVLTALGEKYYRSSIAGLLGRLRLAQGRPDEARALAETARGLATEDVVETHADARGVLGRALATGGLIDDGLLLVQEAVTLTQRTDSPVLQADALVDLATVAAATGTDAGPVLAEAVELYERKGDAASARAAVSAGAPAASG